MKKKTWIVSAAAIAALIAGILCFAWIDLPPEAEYSVSPGQGQSLRVTLKVKASLFGKPGKAVFYTLDGTDTIEFSLRRGRAARLEYDAPLGQMGKHGHRGGITEKYLVFDGGQAFLQPAGDLRRIRLAFDIHQSWIEIAPCRDIKNPGWMDIYCLMQNAFAFGEFQLLDSFEGVSVYALDDSMDSIRELCTYYSGLFCSPPEAYSVVLLPPEDDIVGGAGRPCVAASFDTQALRDWQLLSHRMFHAFFDMRAADPAWYAPPNLWLVEGLATYYENMSMAALQKGDPEQLLAVIYAQYLYMRGKYPDAFVFAPMREAELSGAQREFLHYTAAPLLAAAFEDASLRAGNTPDALLRFCLEADPPPESPLVFSAAAALLGEEGEDFYRTYCLQAGIPPLTRLEAGMPEGEALADALEYIERVMASWAD